MKYSRSWAYCTTKRSTTLRLCASKTAVGFPMVAVGLWIPTWRGPKSLLVSDQVLPPSVLMRWAIEML